MKTIINQTPITKDYPILLQHKDKSDHIILAISDISHTDMYVAVQLSGKRDITIPYCKADYVLFNGSITLSNS